MLNLDTAKVTAIQLFDHSFPYPIDEFGGYEIIQAYSANVIVNDSLVIQLSGVGASAHPPTVPHLLECGWLDWTQELQQWAYENIEREDIEALLSREGVENNFGYLSENATEPPF